MTSGASMRETPGRGIWSFLRGAWPVIRPIAWQILLAAGISTGLALLLGHHGFPVFAPLFAVATMELICARHHRRAVEMVFGGVVGALATAVVGPAWSGPHVLADAAIGAFTALVVAWATTPRSPVTLVNHAVDPLLSDLAGNIRAVATALRRRDPAAAGAAAYALVETDAGLRRLEETLLQVRRSAFLLKWSTGQDLAAHTGMAAQIGDAVRNIRGVAEHAWWGILRAGESVPTPLPQALDALADGIGLLREELDREGSPRNARPLLISSAQWISMMREQHLTLGAAGVAASTDAAVLNLLMATGMPAAEADALQHKPAPAMA